MSCPCAECTSDAVDYTILARYWTPEVWLYRVGTPEQRNDWRERKPDGGPRGELRCGTETVPTNEVNGAIE